MSGRTRTTLVGLALALGFVSPFLVGIVAERRLRDNHLESPEHHQRPVFENAGIKYALDFRHALTRGKSARKSVFLYFTGETSGNARKMEKNVLSLPSVTGRLRKFECSAVFIDHVPFVDAKAASRLYEQNHKLEILTGDVSCPKFLVVTADFDPHSPAADEKVIATLYGYHNDAAGFAKFLDDALQKWSRRLTP